MNERKPAQTRNPNNARLFESLVESGLTQNSPIRDQVVTADTSSPQMKRLTEVNQSKLSMNNRDSVLSIDSGSYLLPFNPKSMLAARNFRKSVQTTSLGHRLGTSNNGSP